MGNIHSIIKALRLFASDVVFTADPSHIKAADALVLPGDGAFEAAMQGLAGSEGMQSTLLEKVSAGTPLLGVCIGFQILFADSNECFEAHVLGDSSALENSATDNPVNKEAGDHSGTLPGLGLIPGHIRRFPFAAGDQRVPHMGWNTLQFRETSDAFAQAADEYVYFIHSYRAVQVPDEFVVAHCDYAGDVFPAMVRRDNILATQFHPEKSAAVGLRMIERWVESV